MFRKYIIFTQNEVLDTKFYSIVLSLVSGEKISDIV